MKILCAVDGSDNSAAVIDHAHRCFGDAAEYLVVTVGAVAPYFHPMSPLGIQPALMWITDRDLSAPTDTAELTAKTATVESELTLADVEVVAAAGDPGSVICRVAEDRDVDVVVVGTHERGWLSRFVNPSVSHHVVDHAPCDVLVIRGSS